VVPPLACDSHCHVFGPEDRFPYKPGHDYYPPCTPREVLRDTHDALGLERGVIVQGAEYGYDNSVVLDAIAAAPTRYRGIAVMDPQASDTEIRRLHDGGMRGIRISLVHGAAGDAASLRRIAARIAPLGWHLEIHVEPSALADFAALIPTLPVPVVIDHMGGVSYADGVAQPAFQILLEIVQGRNGWVKISGIERRATPPYDLAVPLGRALIAAAPDRVVWGSNFPHPKIRELPDDAALLELVPRFTTDPTEQRRLLVDNPARLYEFR